MICYVCVYVYDICYRMNCNEAFSQKSRKHKHAVKKISQERAGEK